MIPLPDTGFAYMSGVARLKASQPMSARLTDIILLPGHMSSTFPSLGLESIANIVPRWQERLRICSRSCRRIQGCPSRTLSSAAIRVKDDVEWLGTGQTRGRGSAGVWSRLSHHLHRAGI